MNGTGKSVVGEVASEVVRVEDGDYDEVEGSADAEVAVTIVEKVRTDPELMGRVVGRSDDDSTGEDEPSKSGDTVPRISSCIPFATPVKMPVMDPKTKYSFTFLTAFHAPSVFVQDSATPANVKLMMEGATALCQRIFAGCITWKR